MTREFTAEALHDGEQAARERVQAEQEMEATLLGAEVERGSEVPIEEQSTTGQVRDDGTDTVILGGVGENADTGAHIDEGTVGVTPENEYEGDERTFEGDGPHALEEQ